MNLLAHLKKRKPRLATIAESRATTTLLSLGIHVREMSLDYNLHTYGVQYDSRGTYSLYDGQILLLALPLFQTSALSLHLKYLKSFPQSLWVCAEKHSCLPC